MQFLKNLLASCLGVIIAMIICFFLLIGLIATLFFSILPEEEVITSIPSSSILHLKLEGSVVERKQDNPLSFFIDEIEEISIEDISTAVEYAKHNSHIQAIYIEVGELFVAPGSAEEIRTILKDFQLSGKPIITYGGIFTQQAYYITSLSDYLMINPQGMLDLKGLAVEHSFYKGIMDKLGVEMQIFKVGNYKSAVEPYINNKMSEESKEQTHQYLQDIWNHELNYISIQRSIPIDTLYALADKAMLFQSAEQYLSSHLVDTIGYESDAHSLLKQIVGIDSTQKLSTVTVNDLVATASITDTSTSSNEIAILYAEGEITSTETSFSSTGIIEKNILKEIRQIKQNEQIKSVVFRVNSPGGSTYSSEQIWKEIQDLNTIKPVVVSMGDYAASGGYYISAPASYIIAQPTTITGSIGIFGMIPNVSGLTNKIGLTFDVVKTNQYADMPSIVRPMSDNEKEIMQAYVERGYKTFINRCSLGRKNLSESQIESIAQGRVWSGVQAQKLGLIDDLGGLHDAINKAAELAGLENYSTQSYPKKKDFMTRLIETSSEHLETSGLKEVPILSTLLSTHAKSLVATEYLQARLTENLLLK